MRESLISKLPSGEPLVSVHLRLTHKGAPIYECAGEVNQRGLQATARTAFDIPAQSVSVRISPLNGTLSRVVSIGIGTRAVAARTLQTGARPIPSAILVAVEACGAPRRAAAFVPIRLFHLTAFPILRPDYILVSR